MTRGRGCESGRLAGLRRIVAGRYPGVTAGEVGRMTVAFLVLHELSAVVPLVAVFGIVHWTGTGDAMLDTVRGWLPPPQPPDPSSSIEPQPPAILASTLENATAKVAKIAARYGYHSPSNHPENEGTSSLDSAVFLLLPVRISLSLYLTPSFARVMHRAACRLRKPDPHKPSPPSSGTS
ncbi:hypothetical protein PCANC_23059 [Puccinia coronata f. sp. avenae]|uniref:Uncharacterized protein n=1 Tax=Puccinia coronata f. sp. avenae TaxID=200324 RepID=A0A2N5VG89_9BASI|nr:hypothetical protein PCANC_28054 [Puccinia coronata f. sp. avenae]PLW33108.1 hypothetical protein PCANC_23059 [Puccinia coronata f. sp. avenae]PLW49028.1 hypothetical protein PCASD_05077 [Puccinia coronata f. sp. avenae]